MKILGCVLLIAATAGAQGVSISNRNVVYRQFRPRATQDQSPGATFTADASRIRNLLFEDGWYYRIQGDPENRALRDDGSLTITNSGAHADADWSDVDGRGQLAIEIDYDAVAPRARKGLVIQRLTVRNIGTQPVTVHLFHYVDADVCRPDQNLASGERESFQVTRPDCTSTFYVDTGVTQRTCVSRFTESECGIRGRGGSLDLDDSTVPFGPADFTAAAQYTDEALEPGGYRVHTFALGHDFAPCSWDVDVYGVASTGARARIGPDVRNPPTIGSVGLPSVGRLHDWPDPTSRRPIVLVGFERSSTEFPGTGLTLQVDAVTTVSYPPPGLTEFSLLFPARIPDVLQMCGSEVHFQVFGLDLVAGTISHTRPITWYIGAPGR